MILGFISNVKGRADSVSATREQLGLDSLEERRKNHHLCFLAKVLQNEDEHNVLAAAYGEINQNEQHAMTTRATKRGEINRVFSRVRLAICGAPIQHAPIHNSDILLHKVNHVSFIMTKK